MNSRQLEAMYAGPIPWPAAEAFAQWSTLQVVELEQRLREIESLQAESRLVLEHARAVVDDSRRALLRKPIAGLA